MSLVSDIQAGVAAAFVAVDDLEESATLNRKAANTYSTSSGDVSGGTTEAIKGIVGTFSAIERSTEAVEVGAIKFSVEKAKLTSDIDNSDTITLRSAEWAITRQKEIASALVVLTLRRAK